MIEFLLFLSIPFFAMDLMSSKKSDKLLPELRNYLKDRAAEFDMISSERKEKLDKIAEFIKKEISGGEAKLTFICTHNSRRSHMAQLWTAASAEYFSVDKVQTFSGGIEGTAFNPRSVKALRNAGFRIEMIEDGDNPLYSSEYAEGGEKIKSFSKKFSHVINPKDGFAAVMVCSDADEACPFVPGAKSRIAIPYDDPKAFDNTPQEEEKYAERSRQIAREMAYVFLVVSSQ